MCKLAYLGIILKADWNVLGVHNKLFYCSTILETSFPPPPLLNANFILTKLFMVSATLQDSPRADRCSISCFYKNPYKPYIF